MKLKGFKVAILLCDGFEEVEMTKPKKVLEKEKATVHLITPNGRQLKSWKNNQWGRKFSVDRQLARLNPSQYDALLLPGGVMNPDKLRTNAAAIKFINYFLKTNKPLAAICHGSLSLIETKRLKGRKLTSYHSIKLDLINAGAKWVNKPVVIDQNLITSRKPADLPQFNKALIQACYEANNGKQSRIKSKEKMQWIAQKRFVNC